MTHNRAVSQHRIDWVGAFVRAKAMTDEQLLAEIRQKKGCVNGAAEQLARSFQTTHGPVSHDSLARCCAAIEVGEI